MKKILFPTDFSETSLNAFVYALQMAKNTDAEIIVLHVYELPILNSNYLDVPIYLTDIYADIELNKFENFKDQIPILRKIAATHHLENIKMSNVLVTGDLVSNVSEIIKNDSIDYVVMGTKGATGLKELFLGSATASVMAGTKANVLGIPETSKYEPIQRIGFTTKFTDNDLQALKKLIDIAKTFSAKIDCVHIKTPNSEINSLFIEQWKTAFKDDDVSFHIIESKDVEDSIIDFVNLHKINLLAILNYERGFFESFFKESLTKKLAYHIQIPLLALHTN